MALLTLRPTGQILTAMLPADPCPGCGVPLNESIYTSDNQNKSCPGCSVAKGRHIFHKSPDAFGFRNNGPYQYIQSHCHACRTGQPASAPTITC